MNRSNLSENPRDLWLTVSPGRKIAAEVDILCEAMDCNKIARVAKTVEAETNSRKVGVQELYLCDDHKDQAAELADWSDWE